MTARELLEALGPALAPAREVRYLKADAFDDLSDEELELAARKLRALSYSTVEGARTMERIISRRSYERRAAAAEGSGS